MRAAQLETSLAEARLHALELQIQPHFLFNTLNAISALVRTGQPEQAVGMIAGLSDLLRYALDRAGNQRVTVDEEAEMLRRYLEIQRLRFADRLTFEIDVAGDARRAAVPVLLLQPLAENAIRHGIARARGRGGSTVRAFRAGRRAAHRDVQQRPARRPGGARHRALQHRGAPGAALRRRGSASSCAAAPAGVTAEVTIPWSEVA